MAGRDENVDPFWRPFYSIFHHARITRACKIFMIFLFFTKNKISAKQNRIDLDIETITIDGSVRHQILVKKKKIRNKYFFSCLFFGDDL